MFSPNEPPVKAPPKPVLLDYDLPDSLRRAREAALVPLRPLLLEFGLTYARYRLLCALAAAEGAFLAPGDAALRAGLKLSSLRPAGEALARDGLAQLGARAWAFRGRSIAITEVGMGALRRIRVRLRGTPSRNDGVPDWDRLAALPDDARFTAAMRARLGEHLTVLTRACAKEAVLIGANAPPPDDAIPGGLAQMLHEARVALVARIAPALRHYDFTEAQWRILRILAWQPGIGWSVTALGRRGCFSFRDPAVKRALVYLSQRGLARRYDPSVRPKNWPRKTPVPKRWRAEVTQNGLDIIAMVERRERIACADLFARLDAERMDKLDRLLARLTRALLWRDGVAAEDQDGHPLGAQYDRFDAITHAAGKEWNDRARAMKRAGRPIQRKQRDRWWD